MIACGVGGLSRGNYDAGISLGLDICQFMPLHLSACDIAGHTLAGWCKSWMGMDYSPSLSPVGWFEDGHQPGVHLCPPPTPRAVLIALKEL